MGHQLVAVGTVNMKLTIVVSVFLMVAAVSYAATLAEESLDKKEADQILARQKRWIKLSPFMTCNNCGYELIREEKPWLEDLEIKEEMKRRLERHKWFSSKPKLSSREILERGLEDIRSKGYYVFGKLDILTSRKKTPRKISSNRLSV